MADKQEITIKLSLDDKDLQKEIKINVDDKEVEGLRKLAELTGKDLSDLEDIQIRIGKGALPIIALGISAVSTNKLVQGILAAIGAFEAGKKVADFINSRRLPPESRSVLDEPPPRTRVLVQQANEERMREFKSGGLELSDEEIAQLIFLLERYKEQLLSSSEIEKELTKISLERIKNIMNQTEELKNQDSTIDNNNQTLKDLTDTTIKDNEENQKSIILKKNNSQSLLELGNNQSASAMAAREHTESLKGQADELRRGNEILELTDEELLSLGGKYAMLSDESGNYTEAAKQASTTTADLTGQNSTYSKSQDQVNQSLDDGSVAFDNVGASAEEFGDTIEQVQNNGGFFEGIKQGFIDFVENVQSNSELMADFFADTLSQMSQSFSDLFFNVITGRFDDLKDLAKQAFEAILRAFLDLVSAIVTKQIVISIAGVLGVGTKGASAGDLLGIGQNAAGVFGDIFGGGGATATNTAAVGSGLGLSLSGSPSPSTFSASFMNPSSGVMTPGAHPNTFFTPEMQASIEGSGPPVETGGGIGAGIGAGLLGISIGSAIGGIINSDLTGLQQGISLGVGAAGAVTGFLIGGPVGAAIGGFIGSLVVPIITALFKKTPRLDIDFDSVKTEVGRRAAEVAEFLDPEFFKEQIAQISVKRGGVGLGRGGDEGIKDIIQEKIKETVDAVQDIINKFPADLAAQLNEALLNTPVDIETVVKGERLLEFDAKGKKIAEKFEAFINGELSAKFLFAIRDFFQVAFESLGVLPGKASEFLEAEFEKFKNAGSREERAKIGQEFLASFNAFVDAFNIVSGNVNDAIGQTIQKEEWEYELAA